MMADTNGIPRTSSTKDEIYRLIQEADSPRDKAYLFLLLDIHEVLVKNTTVTVNVGKKVDTHIEAYTKETVEQIKATAKSRGIWQTTCFFLVILQAVFAWGFQRMVAVSDEQTGRITSLETKVESIRATLIEVEREAHSNP